MQDMDAYAGLVPVAAIHAFMHTLDAQQQIDLCLSSPG